jgi:hypothetical protein
MTFLYPLRLAALFVVLLASACASQSPLQSNYMRFVELANPNSTITLCGTPRYQFMDQRSGRYVEFSQDAINDLVAGKPAGAYFGLVKYPVIAFSRDDIGRALGEGMRYRSKIKPCFGGDSSNEPIHPSQAQKIDRDGGTLGGLRIINYQRSDDVARLACDRPQVASHPKPQRPAWVEDRSPVQITYDLGPDGRPINIDTKGGDSLMRNEAAEWVGSWEFEPPSFEGRAVICRGMQASFNW